MLLKPIKGAQPGGGVKKGLGMRGSGRARGGRGRGWGF